MDVILKQTDKNLGIIPVRGDIYNAMVREWLSEPAFTRVQAFPYEELFNQLKELVLPSRSLSPKFKAIMLQKARKNKDPAPFYLSPKIHKSKLGSRPITAQHSYILSGVSKSIADILQDFVQEISYIGRDSKTTVRRLEEFKPPEQFVFLTYDVEACYPSIDILDAIATLESNMKMISPIWFKLLEMVMWNNYVSCNGKIYLQNIGTATGTQVAPQFANLYLYYKFKKVLDDDAILFQERFIDDGLLIIKTKEDGERIIEGLRRTSNLKLTYELSETQAMYLDITIYKGYRFKSEGKVDLKTYFKPTNKMLYLPAVSNHPQSMKNGIVTGEAIRTLRNSSSKAEWIKALRHIFKGLMARGHKPDMIKRKWKEIRFEDRDFYIFNKTTRMAPEGTIIRTSYNPQTQAIWRMLVAKYPLENVLKKRKEKWTQKQVEVLKKWPPKILWMDFFKIAQKTINSKAQWSYVKKRKRNGAGAEERPLKQQRTGPWNTKP